MANVMRIARKGSSVASTTYVEALEDRRLLATVPAGFIDTRVTAGLKSATAMALAPDGRVFVAEQAGNLRVVKDGRLLAQPFVSLNTRIDASRGLIGVAVDPEFERNHYVYVYYTRFAPRPRNI